MRILGISACYHDASAALVCNGRVMCSAAEERFSRQKHDPGFPMRAIEFCLASAGIRGRDLDLVVFYEVPEDKFTRVLASALAPFPASRGGFVRAMKAWLGSKLWIRNEISRRLDVHPGRIEFVKHHLSHAGQAFWTSGFEEAAILTVDAVGEWTSTGLFHGRAGGIRALEDIPYPHSLGLAYSAFTAFLGFRPNDAECSTMALAAFGEPVYKDQVERIIRIGSDGLHSLDPAYFEFEKFDDIPFSGKFIHVFGQPRDFRQSLPYSCRARDAGSGEPPPEARRFADIAASIQSVFEDAMLALARRLRSLTQSENLCLAGGAALNCVSNARLLRESGFKNLFVPPDPGDGGAALGAALHAAREHDPPDEAHPVTPFLGRAYDDALIPEMIRHLDPGSWNAHRMKSCSSMDGVRLECAREDDFNTVIDRTVQDLKDGRIVGWVQDRFESGPRALGNRSILADPANAGTAAKLGARVKGRAAFRPYALSVSGEDAPKMLDIAGEIPQTAKWMQAAIPVKPESAPFVREALHVDGTTRAQVCSSGDNPKFHQLLRTFGEAGGAGALLNTSFNESGFPIVASPADALLIFARTDLDTLVVNSTVIRKVST